MRKVIVSLLTTVIVGLAAVAGSQLSSASPVDRPLALAGLPFGGATAAAPAVRESKGGGTPGGGSPGGGSPDGRLDPSMFHYAGAFRVPFGGFGTSHFGYGGAQLALGTRAEPSLYMGGFVLDNKVAEITIPTPVKPTGGSAAGLPVATIIQPFADPTGGLAAGAIDEHRLGGLTTLEGQLHWSVWRWYNVTGEAVRGHGWSSPDLANPAPAGIWTLGDYHNQMTAGYLFAAPQDWADAHTGGRRLIAGNTVSTANQWTSSGPSFTAYRPASTSGSLDALALTYYPHGEHEFPGYQRPDRLGGAVWLRVGGVDSVLVVGRKSLGETRYGDGTATDCSMDKGWHGDPYEAQFMLYAAADLAAVAEGRMQPWETRPYKVWSPNAELLAGCEYFLGGAAYDSTTGRLYVSQIEADTVTDEYQPLPVVHVWNVG